MKRLILELFYHKNRPAGSTEAPAHVAMRSNGTVASLQMAYRKTFSRAAVAALVAGLMGTGCGGRKATTSKLPRIGFTETGIASWYGHPYHGRRAANGEIYDMEKLTAAHRTLPFETWVRVKNLSNGKTVDLRIQDRGPFVRGRIIDLSKAGARKIDMIGPGTTRVRLTVIAPPKHIRESKELYAVQVGAFRERSRAEWIRDSMRARYGDARMVLREGNPSVWRVLVGDEHSEQEANLLARRIRRDGSRALVVRVDER
ncbi:MAG: septal ring lytic transglycosylase RlpA family protein [Bryobacteraceae bacterium]